MAKVVKVGRAYIQATYNNTMITLTDKNGDVIAWACAGLAGFKGAKKATPYAAQIIAKIADPESAGRIRFGRRQRLCLRRGHRPGSGHPRFKRQRSERHRHQRHHSGAA